MLPWIFAVLALFVAQTLLPSTIRYLLAGPGLWERLRIALGSRDEEPPLSQRAIRAQRALANLHEALPVFMTLALVLEIRGADELATRGAAVFLGARVLYVPAYLSGITGLRSTIWMASWVGLALMVAALV